MKLPDKIVITAALPYANGNIHIGHLLEYIQADIYARFLKLIKKDALYICASDMHGTPIEINAKKAGQKPELFVEKFWKEHQEDFKSFQIKFDNYYKTHSPENRELSEDFFHQLNDKGYIEIKEITVIYCETCKRSLPDRFVKGQCPNCQAEDQYGDVCEKCSTILKGVDLINPYCVTCKNTPIQKQSKHYFFKLSRFSKQLKQWINSKESEIQPEVRNWLNEWLKKGLEDWCISRDGPYFGFEIPNSEQETGETKYFYVWLDAPIGYLASLKNYCDNNNEVWRTYLDQGNLFHFIGKDITYFHYLFWPAQFLALGYPLPKLNTHGFITVNGEKMSKSRGTFLTAKDFLQLYPAEALRFFYASHLDRKIVDVDLNFAELIAVNNNVLTGNLGNFCYRVLSFAEKNYGKIEKIADEKKLTTEILDLVETVKTNYLNLNFKAAIQNILKIADLGNAYFQNSEPWKNKDSAPEVVGFCVNLAKNLAILIQPVLPEFTIKIATALKLEDLSWENINFDWTGKIKKPEILVHKIEETEPVKQEDSESDFILDLRVGLVKEVLDHPNADSLFIFKVDFGQEIGMKQVVTSLKKNLPQEAFLNKKIIFCLNLKPAKFRGEMSEAMILAAEEEKNGKTKIEPLEMLKSQIGTAVTPDGKPIKTKTINFQQLEKVDLIVKKDKVEFNGIVIKTDKEEVEVHGFSDGVKVY